MRRARWRPAGEAARECSADGGGRGRAVQAAAGEAATARPARARSHEVWPAEGGRGKGAAVRGAAAPRRHWAAGKAARRQGARPPSPLRRPRRCSLKSPSPGRCCASPHAGAPSNPLLLAGAVPLLASPCVPSSPNISLPPLAGRHAIGHRSPRRAPPYPRSRGLQGGLFVRRAVREPGGRAAAGVRWGRRGGAPAAAGPRGCAARVPCYRRAAWALQALLQGARRPPPSEAPESEEGGGLARCHASQDARGG